MARTVWAAFDTYRKYSVDLATEDVKIARASRDYLCTQLTNLGNRVTGFPKLTGSYVAYGSFARRSKKTPLDDIDMLLILNGSGTTAQASTNDPLKYWLKISSISAPLALFPDTYSFVNSTKVLNKIKGSLGTIPQYGQAEIKKTMQAVTLNLKSYTWCFDIVPAVGISNGVGGTAYYLIPDGHGDWIRTDPRIDSKNITDVNTRHDGLFLPLLRILKAWNVRTTKPRLGSYHFETLALNAFRYAPKMSSIQAGVQHFFSTCQVTVLASCADPKALGPNLDAGVSRDTKAKVAEAMKLANTSASWAIYYEGQGSTVKAIAYWKSIFGPSFPDYG